MLLDYNYFTGINTKAIKLLEQPVNFAGKVTAAAAGTIVIPHLLLIALFTTQSLHGCLQYPTQAERQHVDVSFHKAAHPNNPRDRMSPKYRELL